MKLRKFLVMTAVICMMAVAVGCGKKEDSKKEEVKSEENQVEKEEEKEEAKVYDSSAAFAKYQNHDKIHLWENMADMPYALDYVTQLNPSITPYIAENNTTGGCVIVCPGGGYVHVAREAEGYEPAEALNQNNITAFVLDYRTKPYEGNAAMADVFRAIRYVRYHAEEFGINPDKIAVMGFSAGGHLATMSLQHYDEDEQAFDDIDKVSARPDLGILCYPVVSLSDEKTHETTRQTFLGANANDAELIKRYSGEEQVTEDMPPAFIWHCEKDTSVVPANSEDLAAAMEEKGVDCELHIYAKGKHGVGMGTGYGEAEAWFPTCVEWLRENGF